MIKEFVPYELALELKQLGFDEPCVGYYHLNEGYTKVYAFCYFNEPKRYESDSAVLTPTFSQAFRWFREKHNIDAWVQPFVSEKQNGKPFLPDESYAYYIFEDGVYVADGVNFLDSEEAEMACLKKLIDHCKN
jgi:hypothetical protein